MSEKTRSLLYITIIILVFMLVLVIIWLVYNYQIHKLDREAGNAGAFPIIIYALRGKRLRPIN